MAWCRVRYSGQRIGKHAVDSVDGCPHHVRCFQQHRDMNPANHEDAILGFHFAGHIRGQAPAARVDLARLQRASKGAEHSTGRGRIT